MIRPSPIWPLLLAPALAGCPDYGVSRIQAGDVFTQGGPDAPLDILWVIDDSATMSEEQEAVAATFHAFAETLVTSGTDFQLGVTTTDVEALGGALVGPVLSAETEDLDEAFAAQAAVGSSGSRDEPPLEAVRLATSEPLLSGDNADLFRSNADLAVVILTDEDDQSPDDVGTYLAELATAFGASGFRVSAIAGGLPAGCNAPHASAEAAERVIEAVEATGGDFESICELDFEPVMTTLALGAAGMSDRFALTALPDLETMEVFVDGAQLHARLADGWRYEGADNAIVFDGYAIPRPGQTIEAVYYELSTSE